jgi:hypothetical protein
MTPERPAGLPLEGSLRLVSRLSVVLGVFLAGVSIVGLTTGLDGLYEPYPTAAPGLFAQDLVVLLVALPLLAASMIRARRGSTVALLAWGGVLFYAAYTYYFMVIGAFTRLFPAYLLIVALATYGLLSLLFAIDAVGVAAALRGRVPRRSISAFFLVSVALFVILWAGLVASTLAAGEVLSPVQHLVVAIDTAILLPILAYAGVQLLRRAPSGYPLAGILIVKAGLTGFTLAFTGAFAMWWSGQFEPSEGFLVAIFSMMAIVAVALWIPFAGAARPRSSDAISDPARDRPSVVEGGAS